ncbi:hypothetical protein L4D06_16830 [Enterovibrio makurazakiensis]|uniref:Uncharacterized protein n=1 Tax=Enterovibrio gelatinilyticus TaxID=2899819 RepID=A0ABT5R3Y4_9GAMM|nr:hypothetical protein [Enterovibrio sp. ZSDZ42]MDD1794217.1 hypothetical protein [Enterovibrio sp. ZSDZ42]
MAVEQSVVESINAVWATPYGVAAKYIFVSGILLQLILMITRYKMPVTEALLAVLGFKPVRNRDKWFNILHFAVIAVPLALLAIAL